MKKTILFIFCLIPVFLQAQTSNFSSSIKQDENYIKLEESLAPFFNQLEEIKKEYDNTSIERRETEAYIKNYESRFNAVVDDMKIHLQNFVWNHPNSDVSLMVLDQLIQMGIEAEDLEILYNSISEGLQRTDNGIEIGRTVLRMKRTSVGSQAPEFTLNNQEGKAVNLSDFRGKYVLVDFWASWCAPCRKENPNMVAVYNKYKNRKFEILGISLDNGEAVWKAAIKKDGLIWPQVSDLNGWKNEVAILYNVRQIPQNFLLDPTGKIIAKNLLGHELEAKLAEIFK